MKVYNKIGDSLLEAEKIWNNTQVLLNFTIDLDENKRVFIKILENLCKCALLVLNSGITLEVIRGEMKVGRRSEENLERFFEKCGSRYGLNEEDRKIVMKMILLLRKHKESGMEFVKDKKLYILNDDGRYYFVEKEELEEFSEIIRTLVDKLEKEFKEHFKERYK